MSSFNGTGQALPIRQNHLHRHALLEGSIWDSPKGIGNQKIALGVDRLKSRMVHVRHQGQGGFTSMLTRQAGDDVAEGVGLGG